MIEETDMPAGLEFFNGGQRCDQLFGPCACGAWHLPEDLAFRIFNQLRRPPLADGSEEIQIRSNECEELVVDMIRRRRAIGRAKYGVTMEREDLSNAQWLLHAQAEALDLAIYLEKLKKIYPSEPCGSEPGRSSEQRI